MDTPESHAAEAPDLTLRALTGPPAEFTVRAGRGALIGRGADAQVCLLHEGISRRHAMLLARRGAWFIADQGSSRGTFVGGVRLEPHTPTVLATGDLVRIGPWTLRVSVGDAPLSTVRTSDDADASSRVERASPDTLPGTGRRLRLLTECIGRLQEAADEQGLAAAALESALVGSGYARGALLSAVAEGTEASVIATRRMDSSDRAEFRFSRSLILAAAAGEPVVLARQDTRVRSQSIAEMRIHSAMCVPVKMGDTPAGYLYMDAREGEARVQPDAAGFCEAVATAYGLALANLKRADLERRQREMGEELRAAHEAQRHMLPPMEADLGFVRYAMEMRPGAFVGGDLFDVVALESGAVAVLIGDVAGHGVGAAMVMAAVQAHLNSEITRWADPARAVSSANRFLSARPLGGRFVTLWLGVFEPGGRLAFVDAGHGHWLIRRAGEAARAGQSGSGIPAGIDGGYTYANEEVMLAPGDRVVLFTDGIVSQRGRDGEEFGAERLGAAAGDGEMPADDVRRVFTALCEFAGGRPLDDDATAASLEFRGAI